MMRFTGLLLFSIFHLGCVDLDGFVHNPVHCTTVNEDTCEGEEDVWDNLVLHLFTNK